MIFSGNRQKGLTFISIMIILGLIAFFVMIALKVGPIYMNHNKVVSTLTAVEGMSGIENMSKREIELTIAKRLSMNYVDKIKYDDFEIRRQGELLTVSIDYERVEKLMGNLSVLVEFSESFEVGEDE
jgi:hypothetical protein